MLSGFELYPRWVPLIKRNNYINSLTPHKEPVRTKNTKAGLFSYGN